MIRIFRPIPIKNIRLLLFDLDGTLIDSEKDLAASVNAMLRHFGRKELPLEIIDTYIGDGAPMLIRRALGDPAHASIVQEALNFFLLHYRDHKLDTTCPYPGIPQALHQASQLDGVQRKMAVLTNKPVRASRDILAGLGLSQHFFQTYGGNSFETKKPDPYGAQALMQEAGVTPAETVMIGDSQVDVLTARNANLWSIGVTYGFSPQSLERTHPDVLVDTVEELAQVLTV
jgi:phosphoglycolate phosphatase